MKRNLLFLALFVAAFCFSGTAIAQDGGDPDTLYMEMWPGDNELYEPGPWLVKVPLYVTTDIVDPLVDSIAGYVLPMCYHYTGYGAVNYCKLTAAENNTACGYGIPNVVMDHSIFRHMPSMTSPVVHHPWTDKMSDYLLSEEIWDYREITLDDASTWWVSLVPTSSKDKRWEGGSHVLLATMTFEIDLEDSLDLCIDSCFWPPSSRLAFSNSDAETYIPMIWDDYIPAEEYCIRPFIVPNIPPVVNCPGPQSYNTSGVKVVTGVTGSDADGTIESASVALTTACGQVSAVSLVNVLGLGTASFTADVQFTVDHCAQCTDVIEVTLTDDAGGVKTCTFDVTCTNTDPTVTCPATASFKYCDDFAGTAVGGDVDGDGFDYGISGGSLYSSPQIGTDGGITWDTDCDDVGGPYTITVTVTDDCGATGQCTFDLTVTNAAPSITCPGSGDVVVAGKTFVSDDFAVVDDCNDYAVTVTGITYLDGVYFGMAMPTVEGGHVEWVTTGDDEAGLYEICLEVEDGCGLIDDCCFDVELLKSPMVNIGPDPAEDVPCAEPGELYMLPITIVSPFPTDVGGFELHIDFDYTSMTFVEARRGELIQDFEEFTYRLLPCPLCGCCKYKILLFGMFDLPNATMGNPIPAATSGQLIQLFFVINSNENLRGFCIPVCWQWQPCDPQYMIDPDCGENTFSDETGNILYVSGVKDEFGEFCQFDLECCDDPGGVIDQSVLFQVDVDGNSSCNGICFCIPVCEDPGGVMCKRGDVNLNYVTYEVADAVLFSSYFVYGDLYFSDDPDEKAAQFCATDVNADGRTLTLSDLVYLIRVILQDAVKIPKLAPSSEIASLIVSEGTVSAECASPIGALLFEFEGAVSPTLLATNMEMIANNNKVLVWSRTGQTIQNGEVLSANAELVSVQAVDRDSRTLETNVTYRITPTAFALHAAYPNPFNPFVNLSFSMPEAASYKLNIYNVAGQLVRSYEGMASQGLNVITWDGKDNSGSEVSSGVYFYSLSAAGNRATAKMVMMK